MKTHLQFALYSTVQGAKKYIMSLIKWRTNEVCCLTCVETGDERIDTKTKDVKMELMMHNFLQKRPTCKIHYVLNYEIQVIFNC